MEEIIYLEPDEEITSVIDKIKKSPAKRLSLVVPREATLLQSVINLRLLLKETTNLGKEIVLVTSDKIGRNLAGKVGLTVYDSIKSPQPEFIPQPPMPRNTEVIEINEAKEPHSEKPSGLNVHHFQEKKSSFKKQETSFVNKPSWQSPKIKKEINFRFLKKIIWPLLAVAVLLILIGVFLIFPKVKVILEVKGESLTKNLNVELTSDKEKESSEIYGGKMIDLEKEKEDKFVATGKKNLGTKATGILTLYNYWDSNPQQLNEGTKFVSSSKTYLGKTAASIPGTSIKGGNIVPGTASVEIEAENPGEEYNIKAGRFTIVGLPANQQEKIYGQSGKELTGGLSKEVQVVSQTDYDQAKDKLIKDINEELQKDLKEASNGWEVLDQAVEISTAEEISTAKVDNEAKDFNLRIKEKLKVIVYSKNDYENFILKMQEKQISPDKMISLGKDDFISFQVQEKKYSENLLFLTANLKATISSRIDTAQIKKNLLGKSRSEAESILQNMNEVENFEIKFMPNWWPLKRIPNFQRNLEITLDYSSPESPTPAKSPISPTPSPAISPEGSP